MNIARRLALLACGALCAGDLALAQFDDPIDLTSTTAGATCVLAGDFDGDGDQDALTAATRTRALVLHEGQGDGTLGDGRPLVTFPFQPTAVAAGDLDGDGDDDFAVVSLEGDIAWVERTGPSTFATPILLASVPDPLQWVELGDLEGDGDLDIYTATPIATAAEIYTVENPGSPTLAPAVARLAQAPASAASFAVADLDGDGDADAALSIGSFGDALNVYFNDGPGPFRAPVRFESGPSLGLFVDLLDLDGDGDADLVSGLDSPDEIQVRLNDGSGSFSAVDRLRGARGETASVVAIDLDQDGVLDLVAAPLETNGVVFHRGLGAGAFADGIVVSNDPNLVGFDLAPADLDGDGRLDLVGIAFEFRFNGARVLGATDVVVLSNESVGSAIAFSANERVTNGIPSLVDVTVGDLDGNGGADIVGTSSDGDLSAVARGDGLGAFEEPLELPIELSRLASGAADDLDGDGRDDIVVADDAGGVFAFRSRGGGDLEPVQDLGASFAFDPTAVRLEDLDGDGDRDILVAANRTRWFENLGGFAFAAETLLPGAPLLPNDAEVADLDGNGTLDVVVSSEVARGLAILLDVATPSGSTTFVQLPTRAPLDVEIADLDGDGLLDIAFAPDALQRSIWWLRNLGGGAFSIETQLVATSTATERLTALDVDVDGDDDLVLIDASGDLRWIENVGTGMWVDRPDVIASGVGLIDVADLDGDGDDDLALGLPDVDGLAWVASTTLGPIGMNYCGPTIPNSTGSPARMSAVGSEDVARNEVQIRAADMPTGVFGFFLVSETPDDVFPVVNSQGRLCLGGSSGRYVGPGQIQMSDAAGRFSLPVDLFDVPTPFGPTTVQPGETWRFQAWFRDSVGGLSTSNLTDGIAIDFR